MTPARAAFQQHLSRTEGSDTTHNTKHQKSMEHSDMEELGFQLCDYYEEGEYSLICAEKRSE